MDWTRELTRFATHAAPAVLVLLLLLGPLRRRAAALVERIGAARRGRVIALAVLLTVGVRAALVPVVHVAYEADAKEYCEKAAAIARDGHPRAEETRYDGSHFYRTLGYSLPLAGWYRATGMPETPEGRVLSAQAFNLLTSAAIAWLIVALGVAVGRETAGRVAALGYAVFLPAWMFSLLPYTETWATLLVVASALVFEKLRRAEVGRAAALGATFGLLQGLLLITRTEFAWMPALAGVWLLCERRAKAIVPGVAAVGSSRVDLQACKLEYSIVSPK